MAKKGQDRKLLADLEKVRFLAVSMNAKTGKFHTIPSIAEELEMAQPQVRALIRHLRTLQQGDPRLTPLGPWIGVHRGKRSYDIARSGGGVRLTITCPTGFEPDEQFKTDVTKVVDSLNARMVE